MFSDDVRPEVSCVHSSISREDSDSSLDSIAQKIFRAMAEHAAAEAETGNVVPKVAYGLERVSIPPATPDKRKRAFMARRGQVGTIEVSGRWYVVRFWKYPAGQKRVYASEKICPLDTKSPEYLRSGERRRRANEIVATSGVNDFQQSIAETTNGVTFREQAEWFLNHAMNRKRNPIKPATAQAWKNCVEKWLNPNLGDLPLVLVNNASVKALVAKMHASGLAAKSIINYVGLVKLVVASALDENGEQLFPRKWNHEFIDLPVVADQHQPTFNSETMTKIVQKATGQERVLYVLLAGTGMRVGEALGLKLKHLSTDCQTITVDQSCWEGDIQTPKTKNAYRQVDICPKLAELLREFMKDHQAGLLFMNKSGKPLSQTNLLRRSLHPILKELGAGKAGFHAMRRFRTTWLRKQRAPEDIIKFWLGHAKQSVTDGYSKLADDVEFRKQVAENVGTGFEVPAYEKEAVTPMAPKNSEERTVVVSA